jgi:hypothetical protein
MRIQRLAVAALLLLALADADAQTVNYLGDLGTDITTLPANPSAPCYFGNLRTPGALESLGNDIQSFRGEIDSLLCGCDGGWMVSEAHVLLANLSSGPLEFHVRAYVDGQGWCTFPSACPEPHPGYWGELWDSFHQPISLPEPGYYELVFSASSPCAFFGHEYFFKFEGPCDPQVQFVVDADGVRECEVLEGVHIGERWWWIDPHWRQWQPWQLTSGAPIWWVEAECCQPPVPADSRSWGSVKSVYR